MTYLTLKHKRKNTLMSDVKKFTGFIAIDGSTHTSQKGAVEHSRVVKVKAALKKEFGELSVVAVDGTHALDEYIFARAADILAALNQDVLTRKKRTPKAKPAAVEPAAA